MDAQGLAVGQGAVAAFVVSTTEPRGVTAVSRRRSTLIYLAFNYLALGLLIVQGVVLVPTYLRHIDVAVYGAWLATGNVVSYFGVLDLGLNTVLIQRVAHVYGSSDLRTLARVIATGGWLMRRLALLPLLLGLVLAPLIPRLVGISGPDSTSLAWGFAAAGASTSLMFLTGFAAAVLVGLQRQVVSGFIALFGTGSGILFTLWCLYRGLGVLAIPLGLLMRAAIMAAGTLAWMQMIVRRLLPRGPNPRDPAETRALLRPSLSMFAASVCTVLATQSDALVVAVSRDPVLSAQFTITRKSADVMALFATHIANSVMPGLAHLRGSGDSARMQRFVTLSLKVSSAVALVGMGGVLLLNHSFVNLWVGGSLWGGAGLTFLFCVGGMLQVLTSALFSLLVAYGEIVGTSKARIWEAVVRLPLAYALGGRFGMLGVAVAAVLGALPTTVALQAKQLASTLGIPLGAAVLRGLRFGGAIALPTAAQWLIMNAVGAMRPWLFLVVHGVMYVVLCAVTLLALDRDLRWLAGELIGRLRSDTRAVGSERPTP